MKIEIDVSSSDLFCDDYSICVVDCCGVVKSFRFNKKDLELILKRWKSREYEIHSYIKASKMKFKLYSLVVKSLLNSLLLEVDSEFIEIHFCRDFPGYENETINFLTQELKKLHFNKIKIKYGRLSSNSDAHVYAGLTKNDRHNYLRCIQEIPFEYFDRKLKKSQRVVDRSS